MNLCIILQIFMLLAGLPLTMALVLLISISINEEFNSSVLYLILPTIGGFLLKICSALFFYKHLKTQSNIKKQAAQLFDYASRIALFFVAIYLTIKASHWTSSGIIPIFFINFLFLQDYLQQHLCQDFKIQLFSSNSNRVKLGAICCECIGLLIALVYAVAQLAFLSTSNILFQIGGSLFILYAIPLRYSINYNKLKSPKKYLKPDTKPICYDEEKSSYLGQATENHPLNTYTKSDRNVEMKNNEKTRKSIEEQNDEIIEQSMEEFQNKIDSKKNSIPKKKISYRRFNTSNINANPSINILTKSSSDPQISCKRRPTELLNLNFAHFDSSRSLSLKKKYSTIHSQSVKVLWKYLPTIFEEGIAIFEDDKIIKYNPAFSKLIAQIIGQEIQIENLASRWQECFEKIIVVADDSKSSQSSSIGKLNLKEEILKIMSSPLKKFQNEFQAKYTTSYDDQLIQFQIFKKIISDYNYIIIKIDDLSNQHNKISRQASKKIKKYFRLSLAHEVKTPLNYLMSTIRLLKNNISPSWYYELKNSSKSFQLVLNGILKVAFVEDPMQIECFPEKFSIFPAIQKIINTNESLFRNRGLKLIFESDVTDSNNFVYHDKIIIETIVYQLMSNSLKFTKSGGVIVKLFYNKNEEDIEISFADTGIGMDRKEKENLKIFLSSDINTNMEISKHSTGANTGLTICKSLLSRIHAAGCSKSRISFESENNKGSVFTVKISKNCPYEKKSALTLIDIKSQQKINMITSIQDQVNAFKNSFEEFDFQSVGSETRLPQFQSTIKLSSDFKFFDYLNKDDNVNKIYCNCPFRILVVDDEEFNLISFDRMCPLVMKNLIEKYELLFGHDGQEGFDIFVNYFENKKCESKYCCPIKLIVLDYNMPGLTGPELASKIESYLLSNHKQSKVKMCGWTAYIGEIYKNAFIKAGAVNILSKPIKIKELSQIISDFVKL